MLNWVLIRGRCPTLIYLGFDLRRFKEAQIREAELVLAISSSGLGYASVVPDSEFTVYGLNDESLDESLDESSGKAYLKEKVENTKTYTFSGISVINPKLLMAYPDKREKFPLAEILHFGVSRQQISAEVYSGQWRDIGTVERLQALDDDLNSQHKIR